MSVIGRIVAKNIIQTLAYSGQFGAVLSLDALEERLLLSRRTGTIFTDIVLQLEQAGYITKTPSGYLLPGKTGATVPFFFKENTKEKSEQFRQEKLRQTRKILAFLRFIPWVKAVAITGSVAVGPVKEEDDVDFMIITQDSRLWLVRPLVTLIAFLFGKRRSWHKEEPNSWCFNIWVDWSHMRVPIQARSIYLAYEVCQAFFVFDRGGVEIAFLEKNQWVKGILPHYYYAKLGRALLKEHKQNIVLLWQLLSFVDTLVSPILVVVNRGAFLAQLQYMKPHKTREKVTYHEAFFHPRDSKKIIYDGWKQVINNWKKYLLDE